MKTYLLSILLLVMSFVGYSQNTKVYSTGHHFYNVTSTGVIELISESNSPTKFILGDDFISITPPNGEVHVYTLIASERGGNDYQGVVYYTEQGIRINIYRDANGDYKIMVYQKDGHSYLIYDF